jgi:tripartite ATP-independent transporter DctP family solute receptor
MMRKSVLVVMAILSVVISGCDKQKKETVAEKTGQSAGVIELKFAQVANKGGANGQGMEKFAELIFERTNGKYRIITFHDGQLGQETNYIEDCQLGTLDIALINMAPLSTLIEDYGATNLPYLITSTEHADAVFWGELGKYYLEELEKVNLHGLAIFETGFRDLSNSKKVVNTPNDVKGLRIRVMENRIHQDIWRALGADPVPMTWSEAYTAMQQGAIDGQENPAQIANQLNVAEVNKYITVTNHVYSVIPIVMSQKVWKSLDPEDQKIFSDCAYDSSLYQRDLARQMTVTAIGELEKKGVEVTVVDKQPFITATQSVRDKYREQYGEIINRIETINF